MKMMFRVYALYHINEEFESFSMNLPTAEHQDYFNAMKIEEDFKK